MTDSLCRKRKLVDSFIPSVLLRCGRPYFESPAYKNINSETEIYERKNRFCSTFCSHILHFSQIIKTFTDIYFGES